MSTTAQIVAVIAVLASLFLATRGFSSQFSGGKALKLGLIWAIIIVVGTLVIGRLAG